METTSTAKATRMIRDCSGASRGWGGGGDTLNEGKNGLGLS